MNEYKKECWQRYLENQKYEKYDKEDLIDEIIELKSQITQLTNNWNELEEWLKSNEEHFAEAIPFRETLRKMKEIKEKYNVSSRI